MSYILDTNVLVYRDDDRFPDKQRIAMDVLRDGIVTESARIEAELPVHNDYKNKHIAPCINNGHLYNEDCLLARPERVIITEGVTDCITPMSQCTRRHCCPTVVTAVKAPLGAN